MNYIEIDTLLQEMDVSLSNFGFEDFDKTPFGKVETVDQYGGEGEGEIWYIVYHFVDHDVYIRIDGFYMSHNGTDFDDHWYEVFPFQKTITVYEVTKPEDGI